MVISLVKFQTTNTYVAAKNNIIIRYMYIYIWYGNAYNSTPSYRWIYRPRYARFFNACFACISFLSYLSTSYLFYELYQVSVAACHCSS